MTRYARILAGAVAAYPYTLKQMRADHPQTSFPAAPSEALLTEYGVVPVLETLAPVPTSDQNLEEGVPVIEGGIVKQSWVLTSASPEDVAMRQRNAADAADHATVKADAFVGTFLAMTPAEVDAYIEANTATLAQTRALLKKMGKMLLIVARRSLR